MNENEVIKCLKEHIKASINKHGRITGNDKRYMITYIMDFMPYLDKESAIKFYNEKVLPISIESTQFDVKYEIRTEGVLVDAGEYGKLAINKENISEFIKELQKIRQIV